MEVLDNKLNKFGDDLKNEIKQGDKLYIASAVFSMYGYEELKKQLENIDELEFIFTNPTFIKEKKETKEERKLDILYIIQTILQIYQILIALQVIEK